MAILVRGMYMWIFLLRGGLMLGLDRHTIPILQTFLRYRIGGQKPMELASTQQTSQAPTISSLCKMDRQLRQAQALLLLEP